MLSVFFFFFFYFLEQKTIFKNCKQNVLIIRPCLVFVLKIVFENTEIFVLLI